MSEMGEVAVIIEVVRVLDPTGLAEYQTAVRQQYQSFGGSMLARGESSVPGEQPFGPIMVQRWPNAQAFYDWQQSEDYRPLLELRRRSMELRMAVVPLV